VKRRIALVVPAFPKLSETFIVSKFMGLLERGWDVHVVCSTSEEKEWARFPQLPAGARKRVHRGWPHRPKWKAALLLPFAVMACFQAAPGRTWRYLRQARHREDLLEALGRLYLDLPLIRLGPDVVHFEFGALATERMDLRELLGCRITVSFRGYDLNFVGLDQPGYFDAVWAGAAGLHFLGEDLWRRARRRGCPPDRFHMLIPPAIDVEFHKRDEAELSRKSEGSRPLRILSVGRLEWKKGYENALLAIRRLLDRGVACEYRIVGDGDYFPAVAFMRRQLGLEGVVEVLGALPREDVRQEMQSADVLLHSAVSEGFCNAVIEAQSMELPVVCTDADGLRENVADGETGFVVPRRDPEALAAKLEVLARDPALRQRMGKAGRKRVLKNFRLSDQLDRLEDFYRQVLNGVRADSGREEGAEPPPKAARSAVRT
jgi:colanic acid/amylovoran biosynthesis glycosyltransferase